jgi:hypothetical protein
MVATTSSGNRSDPSRTSVSRPFPGAAHEGDAVNQPSATAIRSSPRTCTQRRRDGRSRRQVQRLPQRLHAVSKGTFGTILTSDRPAAGKENQVLTPQVLKQDPPEVSRRHRAPALRGVIAVVAPMATAFVLQVGRRRRAKATKTAVGEATSGPAISTLSRPSNPRSEPACSRLSGTHDEADPNPVGAGEQQESAYLLGFDEHRAHARGRPIAWVVVALIIAGACVSGISLIRAAPWLFWTGVGVVVVGVILGRTTHSMRDELASAP